MSNNLTREERVLKVINRKDVDFLPSQIVFADRARDKEISKALGLSSATELDYYLENHLQFSFLLQDKPLFFRDVRDEMERLHQLDFCKPCWEKNLLYDNWGIGIRVGFGSFFADFHPLQGKATEENLKYMPPNLSRDVITEKDFSKAIKKYTVPDINKKENFSDWETDLKKFSNDFLVLPSGYAGIYERSYLITGWNEFMTNIALKPEAIEELLDKVMEYKIAAAKKIVEFGFKIAHTSDDIGMQCGGLFSKQMFKNIILPRLKNHWEIFNKAGVPIMMHSCGDIIQYIPDLIDIGLKILEPVQPVMDLHYLKKEFGKDLIFYGGIDTQKLPYLTPDEVRHLTKETIGTLGKGGGLIISTSQEIMNDVPIENIKALVETIKQQRAQVLEV